MNKSYNVVTCEQLLKTITPAVESDLFTYSIKNDTRDHLRFLYHHTIKNILEQKRKNPLTYLVITPFNSTLSPKTHSKYYKFLTKLTKLLPNTTIQGTHLDPISIKILINRLQKSTKKNENLLPLIKFGRRNGLKDVVEYYLVDPNFKYALFT